MQFNQFDSTKPVKNWDRFPVLVKRALEVSYVARFNVNVIDLTPSGFYRGLFGSSNATNYHRDFVDAKPGDSFVLLDSPMPLDEIFKQGEPVENVWSRIMYNLNLSDHGEESNIVPNHAEDVYRAIEDDEPSVRMIHKAMKVFEGTYTEMENILLLSRAVAVIDYDGEFKIRSNHVAEGVHLAMLRDSKYGE